MNELRALQSFIATVGAPRGAAAWTSGQLLHAMVIARTGTHQLTLQIGDQRVTAKAPQDFAPGTQLTLRVTKPGPQPQLQIVPQHTSASEPPALDVLRTTLPKSRPLAELPGKLASAITQAATRDLPLAETLRGLEQALPTRNELSTPGLLRDAIRNAGNFLEAALLSRDSQAGQQLPQRDLKLQLLRVARALHAASPATAATDSTLRRTYGAPVDDAVVPLPSRTPLPVHTTPFTAQSAPVVQASVDASASDITAASHATRSATSPASSSGSPASAVTSHATPPHAREPLATVEGVMESAEHTFASTRQALAQQVDSSLARVQSLQLQTIAHESDPRQVLHIELPVRDGVPDRSVNITIQSERRQPGAELQVPEYAVYLQVPLADGDTFTATLRLRGEQVTASLHTSTDVSRQLVGERVGELERRLRHAGLQAQVTASRQPAPPPPAARVSRLVAETV